MDFGLTLYYHRDTGRVLYQTYYLKPLSPTYLGLHPQQMSYYTISQGKRKTPYTIADEPKVARVSQKKRRRKDEPPVEKRQARFKPSCPANIRERMERVLTQRFFLIERERSGEELREVFKVLGSTGNIYTVLIDKLPSCDCPDASKGNHCKHILFVYLKVLNLPLISTHWYQKALLTEELAEIFRSAPTNPTVLASKRVRDAFSKAEGKSTDPAPEVNNRRIPGADDDCPICYESMGGSVDVKKLTFCEQCGNALHTECFQQWARTRTPLTCVWCRANWVTAKPGDKGGSVNEEGYLNLGSVAGVSPVRDTTSYHRGYERGYYQPRSYYCGPYFPDGY